MPTARVIRYQAHADGAEENERLVAAVFAELAEDRPDGLRYATFRLEDGATFLHVALLEGDDNPLARSAAFGRFQTGLGDRLVAAPEATAGRLIGSYRAFGA